jgi:hypothetical protein
MPDFPSSSAPSSATPSINLMQQHAVIRAVDNSRMHGNDRLSGEANHRAALARNRIRVEFPRGDDDLNHGVAMDNRLHSLDGLYLVITAVHRCGSVPE